jgi:hypothetical protein
VAVDELALRRVRQILGELLKSHQPSDMRQAIRSQRIDNPL